MKSLCKLVYEPFETKDGYGQKLVRCVPFEGVCLFEVSATYAKSKPSSKYYVLGGTIRDAKNRFTSWYSWLSVTDIRYIPPGDEAERILTDPLRMPTR